MGGGGGLRSWGQVGACRRGPAAAGNHSIRRQPHNPAAHLDAHLGEGGAGGGRGGRGGDGGVAGLLRQWGWDGSAGQAGGTACLPACLASASPSSATTAVPRPAHFVRGMVRMSALQGGAGRDKGKWSGHVGTTSGGPLFRPRLAPGPRPPSRQGRAAKRTSSKIPLDTCRQDEEGVGAGRQALSMRGTAPKPWQCGN